MLYLKFNDFNFMKLSKHLSCKLGLRSRMQDDSLAEQSSYVMEHSIGTDMEFSTINRLLADFNINRDSSITQRRSPLKSLKITGDSLNASNSVTTYPQRADNDVDPASSTVATARENQGMI